MRTKIVIAAALLLGLAACNKPKTDAPAGAQSAGGEPGATSASQNLLTHMPTRRPGLWIQTMTRDGRSPGHLAEVKMCLDAAADTKLGVFGHNVTNSLCRQAVSRGLDGSYSYNATCKMGAGVVRSKGVITGDFSSAYKVHTESDIERPTGGAPDHHVMDVEARYAGACPADMTPGDMVIGGSLKVNINRMPTLGQAMGGG